MCVCVDVCVRESVCGSVWVGAHLCGGGGGDVGVGEGVGVSVGVWVWVWVYGCAGVWVKVCG